MTGPQLPSPEHATTLDADLRALREASFSSGRCLAWYHGSPHDNERADAAESRLRSRITALAMTMHQVILWTLIGSVVGSAIGTLLFVYVIQPLLERYVR